MKEKLAALLSYHVVPGAFDTAKAIEAKSLKTVQRGRLDVREDNGQAFVDDAQILSPTIQCTDGVVHVIDAVLIPPAPR
jgi:transforming growth factor-beta-induced protein